MSVHYGLLILIARVFPVVRSGGRLHCPLSHASLYENTLLLLSVIHFSIWRIQIDTVPNQVIFFSVIRILSC